VRVTITKLRQDLFKLVDSTLAGETLEFTHKGVVFKVIPETKPSKLAGLTGQPIIAPDTDLEQASRDLLGETESEWEKDWSEL
jgi:antitoxin (DNA-binding transcriptional repressor) of toxin-antitoxin stability system